ncbi:MULTISPECIES: hypothetical protein [Ancylobacter]|jgi:hypothetical protein|uniref:Uncharacterized protein n=2 Tax=Ancylobacter TaxID=99 RepID=A0A1G4TYG4_9HYPH|nr:MULTISPECIES: hypothetical protein [Ancylobacter]MDQ0348561.1 hypothetical protein [Ancylobacter vacuolatus]SCW86377.1 hypothetical protein SAMN05660859_3289 [Ancylobacter rudongensis]
MLQSVYPLLPLLILGHALITILAVELLGEEETAALAPECYPA